MKSLKPSSHYQEYSTPFVLIEYRIEESNEPTGLEFEVFVKSVYILNDLIADWVEVTDSESMQAAEALITKEYQEGGL